MSTIGRLRISVSPSAAFGSRRRLFGALERAYPATFVPADEWTGDGVDAAILVGGEAPERRSIPALELGQREGRGSGRIEFGNRDPVPRSFHGAALADEHSGNLQPLEARSGESILATLAGKPLWTHRAGAWRSAAAPDELADDESIRERLAPGRFVALLPLVDFVRRLTAPLDWTPTPLRACFVVDDPNLYRARYGYIDYAALARTAREHDFHAAMALIPLDAWYASAAASRIFRTEATRLSLLVHGNNHISKELGRERPPEEFDAMFAQALRRVARFERRTGLTVARVMAAPHGAVCHGARDGLDRVGFDAICSTNAYAWDADDALRGWASGGFASGCLAAFPRLPWSGPLDDLPFRTYLGQPLILYGHHDDLAAGPETLAAVAESVRRSGDVRWVSLDAMVKTSVETRVDGSRLAVRLLSRRAEVDVPAGIEDVAVELHPSLATGEAVSVMSEAGGRRTTHAVSAGSALGLGRPTAGTLALRLTSSAELDLEAVGNARRTAWPLLRRALTYTRDQTMPVMRRGRESAARSAP